MLKKINETVQYIKDLTDKTPKITIVLGSGLGSLVDIMHIDRKIPYNEIPHFCESTVAGHEGCLLFGNINNIDVLVMKGRLHFYEGYDMTEITFPMRVFAKLGVSTVILSNAAGGLNTHFSIGDLMLIKDHINLFPQHPLRGKNLDELGTRFPDMSNAYDRDLRQLAKDTATLLGIQMQEGIYVGTQGPTYETPAESQYFRLIGGDAVGMSTIPEVIVAVHSGMKCLAFSVITNVYRENEISVTTHEEVAIAADNAKNKMQKLVFNLLPSLVE